MLRFLRAVFASRHSSVAGVPAAILQFEQFEADLREDFFRLASQSDTPRGLRWISCEWPGQLRIVADSDSQLIIAFSSVNIGFEAIEGGDMEDVAAVSTIRDGSAVFHFYEGSWGSAGRVLFNMDPDKAAAHMTPHADTVLDRAAISH